MSHVGWQHVAFACSILIAPVMGATMAQTAKPVAATTQRAAQTDTVDPKICFDEIFYASMPGLTNYCLGLRDWNNGHYTEGLELLKLSAGWGNKNAQYTLGLIYYNGHHVAADVARGLAWLKLANQRHNDPQIERVVRSAIAWATPRQVIRSDVLYAQLLSTYGDKVAATRAWHHLRHWQRRRGWNTGVVCVYGRQAWALTHQGLSGLAPPGIARVIQDQGAALGHKPNGVGGCGTLVPFVVQNRMVDKAQQIYFHGWMGTVNVGPLKQVPAPASSIH